MKRKIFSSVVAAGLLTCTIATASAAAPICKPTWSCPGWICQIPMPDCQKPDNTPILPDAPDADQKPSVPEVPEEDSSAAMSQIERAACEKVNQIRAAYGLPALTIRSDLSVKARIKSNDMKTNRYFSHNSPTYGTPFQMMKQLGISYRSAGENIAKGYTSAEAVVNAWMASASHRANILSEKYTSMGIGFVDGYWTQWLIG